MTALAAGKFAAAQPHAALAAQTSASGPGPPGSGSGSGDSGGGGGGGGSDAGSGGWGPFGWGRKKNRKPLEQPVVLTLVSFAVTRRAYSRVRTARTQSIWADTTPCDHSLVTPCRCWHEMRQPFLLADHGQIRARISGSHRKVSGLQAVLRRQRHSGALDALSHLMPPPFPFLAVLGMLGSA